MGGGASSSLQRARCSLLLPSACGVAREPTPPLSGAQSSGAWASEGSGWYGAALARGHWGGGGGLRGDGDVEVEDFGAMAIGSSGHYLARSSGRPLPPGRAAALRGDGAHVLYNKIWCIDAWSSGYQVLCVALSAKSVIM
ncbi:hypothetical protein EJB05_26430, partial [Eragrostis curvula]